MPSKPKRRPAPAPPEPLLVHPAWILKGFAFLVGVALLGGYLTFCWLFYQGQWQLLMHPQRSTQVPPQIDGSPVRLVRLEPDEAGIPQLTAWSIPPTVGARYRQYTAVVLPAADGSLATQQALLDALHRLGFGVFAIDYRGFGQSAEGHPSSARMHADAEAAVRYLIGERHLPDSLLVPVGDGLGASLAVHLAASHPAMPAIMLIDPAGDTLDSVRHDPRTTLLPVRLLLQDPFPLASMLRTLTTPKLIVSFRDTTLPQSARRDASAPKRTAELPGTAVESIDQPAFLTTVSAFADTYLTAAPAELSTSR
jgi:pimeloyl-ACP methyl ester carboxylesterase